jgi:hypothetical protein
MRLWSLHPKYLDSKGLVAVWREGLLAQAALAGETRGYRNHPQLIRFKDTSMPRSYIATYLKAILTEATRRGYRFNGRKIGCAKPVECLFVTGGQLSYEWVHLRCKLKARAPAWLEQYEGVTVPRPHPLFQAVAGEVEEWEVAMAQQGVYGRLPQ